MDQQMFTVINDYCKLKANGDAEKYLMLIDQMFEANNYPKLNIVLPPFDDVTIPYNDTPSPGSPDQNETSDEVLSRIESPQAGPSHASTFIEPSTPVRQHGSHTDLSDIFSPSPARKRKRDHSNGNDPDQNETSGEVLSRIDSPQPGPSSASTFFKPSKRVRLHGSQTGEVNPRVSMKRLCPLCKVDCKSESNLKYHIVSQLCKRVAQHLTKIDDEWHCNYCNYENSKSQGAMKHVLMKHKKKKSG